jgi:fibronectin type 3 domain-containing protein
VFLSSACSIASAQSSSAGYPEAVSGGYLSGTGESASHKVTLSWSPPKSSTDPVAGYYVYRSLGGSSPNQQLNSSSETQTTYVDSTVHAGVTYDYLVRSVDSSGRQSSASNNVSTTIP